MLRRVVMSLGNTYMRAGQLRMVRMAGKADAPKKGQSLGSDPEYKGFKSVDQIEKDKQNEKTKPWLVDDHMSATDEINHRGIDQRAKEWGVSVKKVEKLKAAEAEALHPMSRTNDYKKTVLGRDSEHLSGSKQSKNVDAHNTEEKASDRKFTNQDTTRSQMKNADSTKLDAIDEINRRGVEQRAQEWGVPVDTLEKEKPWEHRPAQSKPEQYKKTVLRTPEDYKRHNYDPNYDPKKAHMKSGDKPAADQKYTDQNREAGSQACKIDDKTGKCGIDHKHTTDPEYPNTNHHNPSFTKRQEEILPKNAQTNNEMFDQNVVDKAMGWVKDKFGGSGSSGKQGPTGDHNAVNKGTENHVDSVHKATFTKYEDAKKPFTSSVEDGVKKTEKKDNKH